MEITATRSFHSLNIYRDLAWLGILIGLLIAFKRQLAILISWTGF
jgi:hypothetical protein